MRIIFPVMKVAVLSPVAWRTPPRHYGPWEQVASNITEGLIKEGIDVTLFATGDSITTAKLDAVIQVGYEETRKRLKSFRMSSYQQSHGKSE